MSEIILQRRPLERGAADMRECTLERDIMNKALGSCLVSFGQTQVLCSASIEPGLPLWRERSGLGWLTAEYAMLPGATPRRSQRENIKRKGRSMEIERLIGRSLRAAVDFKRLGQRTITIDCDVLSADGGTRTASITGAWVALYCALERLLQKKELVAIPLTQQIAAVSAGIVEGQCLLDLDYPEDSSAEVDLNLVGTSAGGFIELQTTGEQAPLQRDQLNALLDLAEPALDELYALQREVTGF